MSTSESFCPGWLRWASTLVIAASLTGCTHLFYRPSDMMHLKDPHQIESLHRDVEITSSDGTKLAGWWFPARAGGKLGTVVQFHGNAENMTSHFASLFWMIDEGYDLLTFDYRGYGVSEGKPSQEGLNRDAQAAIRYALANSKGPVVLYGQSLGGAVLLRAYDDIRPEERAHVRALVIESSFYSYKAIARDVLARSWLTFLFQPLAYVLVSDGYSPEEAIARVAPTRVLVIHGDADPVIPLSFGKKIYELAHDPKRFVLVPNGGHITAMNSPADGNRAKLLEFIRK
jgi:fermentation-respiration switch protein FrsA (DUF1100 family)